MRYRLLDTLRGISVVPWFQGTAGHVWQQSICWAFILISGFCMGLKKEDSSGFASCKRGLILAAAGILVTVSTFLFTPESPIIFGVLFFLGCAMLLTTALTPLLRNCSGKTGLLLTSLLFFLLRNINEETLGFEGIVLFRLPEAWYEQGMLATFLGFQDKNFFSTDYFSLLPWYFLFLAGYFLCRLMLERTQTLPDGFANGIPLFEIPGRHSLLIYLLHQPVILLLLSVVLKPVIRAM